MIIFPPLWDNFLGGTNYTSLLETVAREYERAEVFPPQEKIFRALELVAPQAVKVVIIGQDPYHGKGQACGLSFSVADGVKCPPSLVNIFKEVTSDTGSSMPLNGDLSRWAEQGVLLLNSTLTVESGRATSHQKLGWENVTQKIIDTLGAKRSEIVYILWGSHAQRIGSNIDPVRNLVIRGVHPSPLSSYRGFFGSRPFTAANEYLINKEKEAIIW